MSIAKTILSQLGGSRFVAMTGAKDMMDTGNGLQFSIGRGASNKANKVRVTLLQSDTYKVEFFRWNARKLDMAIVGDVDGVYADALRQVFTSHTGLDCHL